MKIAFIGQKGIPARFGGIERHVEELALRMVLAGHTVFAYARKWYTDPQIKSFEGIKVISLPSIRTKHLDAISQTFLASLHAIGQNYDVIHYHGVGPALLSWIPRLFNPRARVVVTFHCIDRKHQKWGLLARLSLKVGEWAACKFAHETIVVSQTLQHYCTNTYDCEVAYIPNGVTTKTKYQDDLIANQFGLKKDSYIAMVSRLVRHKGAHYLIEAYKSLKTNKKLVIVGDSSFTDDYVDELKKLAQADKNIVFTGYQQGEVLHQLFANAAFIVHPSESEGLPIAVLEAMSYGKTVLASDIPENAEVVRSGVGFTFRNKSVADLARKMRFLLDNKTLATQTGQAAKKFVLKNYHWDDIAEQTIKLYEELLTQGKIVDSRSVVSVKQ